MANKKKSGNEAIKYLSQKYWVISTIVLAILLIAVLISNGIVTQGGDGIKVGTESAGQKILDFAEKEGVENVELISSIDNGALYEVTISVEGREILLYVTNDGENLIAPQDLIPLDAAPTPTPTPTPTPSAYSEADLVKIKAFSQCLADNGVQAYGAGWCGYCNKLKEAFGGAEQITPFYLECQNADRTPTEYAELCQEEKITGFPTIKINGQLYTGARTIEGLANAVSGCDAPVLGV